MTQAGHDLTRRTVHGLQWTYLATGVSVVLQVGYTAVMGRLIAPEAYGVVAAAQVVVRLGQYVAELGLGPALVQRKELTARHLRASLTTSVLLGAVLALGVALAAPLAAGAFGDPQVVAVLRVLGVSLLLGALDLTPRSLLRRRLAFKQVALLDIGSFGVGYLGVGLASALLGAGVWSLVAAVLAQQLIAAVGSLALARPPLAPLFALRELRALYGFGGMTSAISLLEYASSGLTTVVIGRRAGAVALGQFSRGSLLIELPLYHLSTSFSKVLFPALSRIQDDRERVRGIYLFAVRSAGGAVLPIAAGAAVAAPELVAVVLGPAWGPAAAVLPAIAAASALTTISHFGGIVAEALAELRRKLALQAVFVLVLVGGLLLNRSASLVGFGVALAAAEALRVALYAALMSRVLSIPVGEHLAAWRSIVLSALAVAGGIAAWTYPARELGVPTLAVLAGQLAIGALILLLLLRSGPLRSVRDELLVRLASAGLLLDRTRVGGLAVRVLGSGRAQGPTGAPA